MATTTIEIAGGMFDSTEITETVDGFPVGNKAVSSEFFAKMITSLYSNGISQANGATDVLRVRASGGMYLHCLPGVAWIDGYMAWNRETISLPVAAGNTYVVYIRMNPESGSATVCCAENPAEGQLPVRNGTVYDMILAKVRVPDNAVAVREADIEDCRYDSYLCGVVTGVSDSLGTVEFAANAGMLGGTAAGEFLKRSGGTMTGALRAAADNTGVSAVRNIGYGSVLPASLAEGEIFILLE